MSAVDHWRRRFLLSVFVVSGFTGLIYESIWSQYLKLFLGHAGYAQTLVLTIFMGGRSVQSISYATAPYLTAPELTGLSDRITSSACYRAVDGVQRTWTDLYVAVAARDAKQIVKLGTDLLGSTAVTSKDDLAYLTTLVAVTHLRMGEVAEARGLLLTQWNRLDQGGWYGLALREMLVMSGATHSARVALAHP